MKRLLLLIVLLITLPVAFADINDSELVAFWSFDANANDNHSNGFDCAVTGAAQVSGCVGDRGCYSFDGNDELSCTSLDTFGNTLENHSVNFWVNFTSTTADINPFGLTDDNTPPQGGDMLDHFRMNFPSADITSVSLRDTGSKTYNFENSNTIDFNDGDWHMLTVVYDIATNNTGKFYVDGSIVATTNSSVLSPDNFVPFVNQWMIGARNNRGVASAFFIGRIDEFGLWNRSLTTTEITELYNSGDGLKYPFSVAPPPPSVVNESLENTFEIEQVGTVNINSPVFNSVLSGDFNVSHNTTDLYIGVISSLISSVDNTIECQVLVDGNSFDSNIMRSNSAGEIGSLYVTTVNVSLENGSHNADFECRRSVGGGVITMSDSVMIGHLMVDEFNNTINHEFNVLQPSFSSSSFVFLDSFLFTVNDTVNDDGVTHNIVFDWNSVYENTGVSDSEISTFLNVNGTLCAEYPRYVSAGEEGVVGGDCLLINVSPGAVLNVSLFGKSNESVGSFLNFTVHTKDFFTHAPQTNFSFFNGSVVPNDVFGVIDSMIVGNVDHSNLNLFAKAGIPVQNSGATNMTVFFRLNGSGVDVNSSFFSRAVSDNTGVLIVQNVFNNIPVGNYTLSLVGMCALDNCSLVGGGMIGYITDVTTILSNAFNVTAKDFWDNTSVQNFTVAVESGTSFSTTTGSVLVLSEFPFDNLTTTSPGLYFANTTFNHNTTLPLNVSLIQTSINFSVAEVITNTVINGSSFVIDGRNLSVFNLRAASYNVTVFRSPYFALTQEFSVVPLQTGTVNLSGLFDLLVNVSVNNIVNGTSVQNFSGVITNDLFLFSDAFSTTNNFSELGVLQNLSYFVQLDTISGLANTGNNASLTQVNTSNVSIINLTFNLFTNNSVNFTILNLTSNSLVTNNVDIVMAGSTITLNFNTSTGTLFVDMLPDDTYTTTFSSVGFDNTQLFVTLGNSNHLEVTAFMSDGKAQKDFIVQDSIFNAPVDGAVLTFLQGINGTQVTVAQTVTDFSGRAIVFLDENVTYSFFVVKDGFNTFTGDVLPTQDEYIIILDDIAADLFVSVFDDVKVATSCSFVPGSPNALISLIINSVDGDLQFYGMNTTYRGTNFFVSTVGIPGGGIETFNITNVDVSIEDTIVTEYFFKTVQESEVRWNQSCFLTNITGKPTSITGGLFSDLTGLPVNSAIRGIMGFVIVLLMIFIFGGLFRQPEVALVAGIAGLGISAFFELLPNPISIFILAVLVILMVADFGLFGGRR